MDEGEYTKSVTVNGDHNHSSGYGSTDARDNKAKSLICELTLEALPSVHNYKNGTSKKNRPSLSELHEHGSCQKSTSPYVIDFCEEPEDHGFKLGWIQGVFIPCLLNIWGVMLFLRMPWVVAQAGILQALVIIFVSTFVCVLTTLSLSALCTNGEVKGGGIYFIISRSLGPEFGASVGIVLAFANAVSASLNTIGFCDSFIDFLEKYYNHRIFEDQTDSVRLVGVIAIIIMILICATGIEWESKAQNFLIAVIAIAIVDFFAGATIGPQGNAEKISKGFTGFSWNRVKENLHPDYTFSEGMQQSFFTVFAIFFPSVTGIQAGANISGDLKDPSGAIPKGTLLSLLASVISYGITVIVSGATAVRKASGNTSDISSFDVCPRGGCQYGMHYDFSIMQMMAVWGLLIYAGCFSATISTALTNLLTVPRLLAALGHDNVYPGLTFFTKTYGKSKEPYRGYVLTFFLSSAFVLIAKINAIAPLISNFYLASYALINFCTFHAALVEPLGWRPTFQYYNKWLSLFSCLLCLVIMFLIDWITSFVTFVVFFTLYLLVMYRQPDVNWGSSTQAQIYKSALASSHRLTNVNEHVKNYQPQILVLIGPLDTRPALLDIAHLITRNNALLLCADIIKEKLSYKQRREILYDYADILNKRKMKGFCCVVDGMKFEEAARGLMLCCGIGKLRPNILMMGYKSNWTENREELQTYFNILHNAFDNHLGVAILRMPDGLDISSIIPYENGKDNLGLEIDSYPTEQNEIFVTKLTPNHSISTNPVSTMPTDSPFTSRQKMYNVNQSENKKQNGKKKFGAWSKFSEKYLRDPATEDKLWAQISMFTTKKKSGKIDVWWLYDDGGLTILLPYILSTRSIFSNCKLRIFSLSTSQHAVLLMERNMADLLDKFRIKYSSLKVLNDVSEPRNENTLRFFDDLIRPFRTDPNSDTFVSDNELKSLTAKTNRQLRLRELLTEYSKESTLIVMSLPMPRKGVVSAALYMAWLEILTKDMPPFLLVRGNHTSVLTFYS